MDIPHDLITYLTELTDALDENGSDLPAILSVLVDDLITAVPSFLGLTMTLPQQTLPQRGTPATGATAVTLNFLPPARAGEVGATLLVPMPAIGISAPGGTVVFYAARPGAFVDLAADTRFTYGLDGQVQLDEHLPTLDRPSDSAGYPQTSTINQAVGVLLDHGHTPEVARFILHNRAHQAGVPLHHAAQQVLDNAAR